LPKGPWDEHRTSTTRPQHQGEKPPFPEQPQDPPGVEAAMDPRPDYGEDSWFSQDTVFERPAQSDESRYITGEVIGVTGGKPIS